MLPTVAPARPPGRGQPIQGGYDQDTENRQSVRRSVGRSVGPPPYPQEIFSYGLCGFRGFRGFRGLGDWLALMAPPNEIRVIRS